MDFKFRMSFLMSMVQAMHTAHMVPFSTLNNVSTMVFYLKPIILRYPFLESPLLTCTMSMQWKVLHTNHILLFFTNMLRSRGLHFLVYRVSHIWLKTFSISHTLDNAALFGSKDIRFGTTATILSFLWRLQRAQA